MTTEQHNSVCLLSPFSLSQPRLTNFPRAQLSVIFYDKYFVLCNMYIYYNSVMCCSNKTFHFIKIIITLLEKLKNGVTIKQLYKDIEYDVFGRHLDTFIFLSVFKNQYLVFGKNSNNFFRGDRMSLRIFN